MRGVLAASAKRLQRPKVARRLNTAQNTGYKLPMSSVFRGPRPIPGVRVLINTRISPRYVDCFNRDVLGGQWCRDMAISFFSKLITCHHSPVRDFMERIVIWNGTDRNGPDFSCYQIFDFEGRIYLKVETRIFESSLHFP